MNPGSLGVVALAVALDPSRAPALLSRHGAVAPGDLVPLVAASRPERLAALQAALGTRPGGSGRAASVEGTLVRAADAPGPTGSSVFADPRPAWPLLRPGDVLPFDLPPASPALLQVDPSVLELGARAARAAASGLSSVLGGDAVVRGRLLPGVPEPGCSALVPIDLTALAGPATLAVECGFAARLAARFAGDAGDRGGETTLSPAGRAVVELAVLGALDALAAEPGIEESLAPRLAARGSVPSRPVAISISVEVAGLRGRALLLLPDAALRALSRPAGPASLLLDATVHGSLRSGGASLDPGEADALAPGDVILLDDPPGEAASLHLPGGAEIRGRIDGDALDVASMELPEDAPAPPVLLDVELASVTLSVRDLARVSPGAVVPLGVDRSGRVVLRIGQRPVATGELVDVGGAVGVRILFLGGAP